jgi:acetolactate synthase-1/3 small subunit
VDVNPRSLTIEVTGSESKVDAMLELLKPFQILEVARTGVIALARGTALEIPPKQAPSKNKGTKKTKAARAGRKG